MFDLVPGDRIPPASNTMNRVLVVPWSSAPTNFATRAISCFGRRYHAPLAAHRIYNQPFHPRPSDRAHDFGLEARSWSRNVSQPFPSLRHS